MEQMMREQSALSVLNLLSSCELPLTSGCRRDQDECIPDVHLRYLGAVTRASLDNVCGQGNSHPILHRLRFLLA